jgi:hypothetical protein
MRPVEIWCSECREFCCANCGFTDSRSQDAVHRSHHLIDLTSVDEVEQKLSPLQREMLAAMGNHCENLLEESLIVAQAVRAFFEEELLLDHDRYAEALLSLSATTMTLCQLSVAVLPTEVIHKTWQK